MPQNEPVILAFVADLIFAVRIEEAARRLNFHVRWIEDAAQIAAPDLTAPARQFAEHLEGPGAALIECLTAWSPALIIFDLGNPAIPWRQWLPLLKSVPATRRIPALCYGSHVDGATMRAAQERGADAVLARSRFIQDLPGLIQQYARLPDLPALQSACQEPLSELALHGLALFNQGQYFQAHEVLEEAWNEDQSVGRELYRAVLQVAVAYLQIERRNYNGAAKMFLRLRQWIDPLPDQCRGVDVARLRQDAQAAHAHLLALGREQIADFDRRFLAPVHYQVGL